MNTKTTSKANKKDKKTGKAKSKFAEKYKDRIELLEMRINLEKDGGLLYKTSLYD